jgi:hypothetical protein
MADSSLPLAFHTLLWSIKFGLANFFATAQVYIAKVACNILYMAVDGTKSMHQYYDITKVWFRLPISWYLNWE